MSCAWSHGRRTRWRSWDASVRAHQNDRPPSVSLAPRPRFSLAVEDLRWAVSDATASPIIFVVAVATEDLCQAVSVLRVADVMRAPSQQDAAALRGLPRDPNYQRKLVSSQLNHAPSARSLVPQSSWQLVQVKLSRIRVNTVTTYVHADHKPVVAHWCFFHKLVLRVSPSFRRLQVRDGCVHVNGGCSSQVLRSPSSVSSLIDCVLSGLTSQAPCRRTRESRWMGVITPRVGASGARYMLNDTSPGTVQ